MVREAKSLPSGSRKSENKKHKTLLRENWGWENSPPTAEKGVDFSSIFALWRVCAMNR